MDNRFEEFAVTPELTLDPFREASQTMEEVVPAEKEENVAPVFDESMLSEDERRMIDSFAKQIDLSNSNVILHYGAGTQKKLADFSESALNNVKTKELGEVGELLTGVVKELKSFGEEEEKGFRGFFKKSSGKLQNMKAQYAKAEVNVNRIVSALESHQIQLLKDVALLDKMYELNLTYYKELSMYILAGKKKLAQVQQQELPALIQKAKASGRAEDAQEARDLEAMCGRFEKKIYDLELTRTIAMQTAPQIRMIQSNDTEMAEKIQSTIVNTIPLWKSQMVLTLGAEHSARAAEAQREVTDMTNELLMKNAQKLKTAAVNTARETERGVVEIETLKAANESLISTFDEVMNIQQEGRAKRREAEAEMARIENELKTKLLQIQGGR